MANKPPAFQFYAADWLSSTRIALMSAEQERGYLRLLLHAWNDPTCSLPDDPDILARLSLMNEGWFNGNAELVRGCFIQHPEIARRIINEKLYSVWERQQFWREKSAEGGVKSGKSRKQSGAQKGLAKKRRVVEPPYEANTQPNGNHFAPSASCLQPPASMLQPSVSSLQASASGAAAQQQEAALPLSLSRHDELRLAWNAIPKLGNLPGVQTCREMTAKRISAHAARMKSETWNWREALDRLATSAFCQGGGKDGWRADIDFFLRPDTVARILEGKYDDRNPTAMHDPRGTISAAENYLRMTAHERE